MNYNNLITGLRVQTQIPLDYKGYTASEATLVNLGVSNNLAFTYHKGLIIYCKLEGTRWEWKQVPTGFENTGKITTDFIYPANYIVDGVDYSSKRYNFFSTAIVIPSPAIPPLQQVLAAGNTTTSSILFTGTNVSANLNVYQLQFQDSANKSYMLNSGGLMSLDAPQNHTILHLPVNPLNDVTFNTPLKPAGTYTLATTADISTGLTPPFEKIDEGNGNGYIIRERNNTFYGNIGTDAIDFSYSNEISSINGATGINSFAIGDHVIASNYLSSSFGYRVNNNGIGSFNTGFKLIDNGYTNFLTGIGHNVTSMNVTVVGQASNIISEQILDFNSTTTKALFVVGNGTIENGTEADFNVLTRSDAFIVRMNGLATLPSVTNALISAEATGKVIVTREYLESLQNKQKVITYPADFTGTDYIITSADMGYSIIIVNGATAVTVTVPTTLVAKMQVGFIQDGTGDVTITPSGTTLHNAISGYKIKGQYDQVFLEQGLTTSVYYLLGNTKV